MIDDIVLTKEEFKKLDLKMVGTYGTDIIYSGSDSNKSYLLSQDYCDGKGTFYKGIVIFKHEETRREMVLKIMLDIDEKKKDYECYCKEYENHKRIKG